MKEVLDSFAEAERHEHAFTNRTGALESSIYASELIEVGDQAVVEFGAHEEYAEFVERRGYMDMEGQAQAAENEIESLLDSNAITIGAL
jgi:hypothetical protein